MLQIFEINISKGHKLDSWFYTSVNKIFSNEFMWYTVKYFVLSFHVYLGSRDASQCVEHSSRLLWEHYLFPPYLRTKIHRIKILFNTEQCLLANVIDMILINISRKPR